MLVMFKSMVSESGSCTSRAQLTICCCVHAQVPREHADLPQGCLWRYCDMCLDCYWPADAWNKQFMPNPPIHNPGQHQPCVSWHILALHMAMLWLYMHLIVQRARRLSYLRVTCCSSSQPSACCAERSPASADTHLL